MAFDLSTAMVATFSGESLRRADEKEKKKPAFDISSAEIVGDMTEPEKPAKDEKPDDSITAAKAVEEGVFGGEAKELTFTETMQALRGDDIEGNLQRLGYEIIPEIDEITGEEIYNTRLQLKKGDERYVFDIDSLKNQLLGAIRPTAQASLGTGGALAGASLGPGGAVAGGALAGTAGGQLVDLAVDFFADQGLGYEQAIEQAKRDALQETTFSLGGEIAGRALQPVIEGAVESVRAVRRPPEIPLRPRVEPTLDVAEEFISSPRDIRQIAQSVSDAEVERVIPEIRPRSDVIAAAKAEGFDLTPDQYSGNPAFIEFAQAAKSAPGSTMAADEIATITKLGRKLDDMKLRLGGDIDKALVNQQVADEFTQIINGIKSQEEKVYKRIAESIPEDSLHVPAELMRAVNAEAKRVGGKQNLRGVWKQINQEILSNMRVNEAGQQELPRVTYGFIDDLRKDIGAGYNGQGGFKDARTGQLDQAYKVLSQEQQNIAASFGENVAADMNLARKMSAERIGIQKNVIKFGKDLVDADGVIRDGPFVNRMEAAIKTLANGNERPFNDLVNALPPNQRRAAVITAIDPLLSSSRLQGGKVTATMANAGRALNRNKTAKMTLYKELPKDEAKRLDNLFTIADGVFSSVERQNVSRTARDVIAQMDKELAPLKKVYMAGRGAARFVAPTTTAAADVGTDAVRSIVGEKTGTAAAADDLFASQKFRSALNEYINAEQFAAQRKVLEMPEYKQWLKTLPKAQRNDVERIGFFNWMFRGADIPESSEQETELDTNGNNQ